jgi:hypothetical protein
MQKTFIKIILELVMVAHTYNSSTWEAEAGESWVHRLSYKMRCLKNTKQKKYLLTEHGAIICNLSIHEAKIGGLWVQGQPGQLSETLSQNKGLRI